MKKQNVFTGIISLLILSAANISCTDSKDRNSIKAEPVAKIGEISEKTVEKEADVVKEDTLRKEGRVKIQPVGESLSRYSNYEKFTMDETEPVTELLLTAEGTVRDLKLLELEFVEVSNEGKVKYNTKEMYTAEKFSPDYPIAIKVTFYGSIPRYGITYIEGNGNKKYFSINQSGMDGSAELIEF